MLHLCYSNRLEVLTAPLIAQIDALQEASPMMPIDVVTPNRLVEQYITLKVAEQLGIAANLRFSRLSGLLRTVLEQSCPELSVSPTLSFQLAIFELLIDKTFLALPELSPVKTYLGDDTQGARQMRCLQLSGEIARLFEEYSYSRGEMLNEWCRKRLLDRECSTERWQMTIYHALVRAPLSSMSHQHAQLDLFGTQKKRPEALHGLMESLSSQRKQLQFPEQVMLFGLSYLAPEFIQIFESMSTKTNVHIYGLNPCVDYWGDVHKQSLKRLKHERLKALELPAASVDDDATEDTAALRLWGRPGREYLEQLNNLPGAIITGGFIDPLDDSQSLLARVQSDILTRKVSQFRADQPDKSIKFISGADIRSEMEGVALTILATLDENPELTLRDFSVLICNHRKDEYFAALETVFSGIYEIPYNTVDGSLSASSPVISAVNSLFSLVVERYRHDHWLSFLSGPMFWGDATEHAEFARRWLGSLPPCIALTNEDLNADDLGSMMTLESALASIWVNTYAYTPPSNDLEGTIFGPPCINLAECGDFRVTFERISDFVTTVSRNRTRQMSISQWALALKNLIHQCIHPTTHLDEYALGQVERTLMNVGDAQVSEEPLSLVVVTQLIKDQLQRVSGGMGQLLSHGVVVSTLVPMRLLPAKVVILMGLDNHGFPSTNKPNVLDLRQRVRKLGDVNDAERDRYLFLESLLSARTKFVCSYVGINPTSGEEEGPSALLDEFIFILEEYLEGNINDALTHVQPALPWHRSDRTSVPQSARLDAAFHLSNAQGMTDFEKKHLWRAVFPFESEPEPSKTEKAIQIDNSTKRQRPIHSLRQFLKSPLQTSAKYTLSLSANTESESEHWFVPMDEDRFSIQKLASACFWMYENRDAALEEFERLLRALRRRGRSPMGVFFERSLRRGRELLTHWWENANLAELGCPTTYIGAQLGDGPRGQKPALRLPPLTLKETSLDTVQDIAFGGEMYRVHQNGHTIVHLTGQKSVSQSVFVGHFICATALAAVGKPPTDCVRFITLPREVPKNPTTLVRYFHTPSGEEAKTYLQTLYDEMTSRFHHYQMPIEAVLDFLDKRLTEPSRAFSIHRYGPNSDKYGPIDGYEGYAIPDTELAIDWIDARFGPWLKGEQN